MSTESVVEQVKSKLVIRNELVRCMLSEFLGTFLLALLADGAIAGNVLSETNNHLWIATGVGLAVAFGVWVGFGVSGGHVNPAVTLGLAASGKFPFKRLPWYCLAQFAGGFFGSLVCFLTYFEGIVTLQETSNSTCGIFTTFPAEHTGFVTGFLDQIVTTGLLMGLILMLVDKRNSAPDAGLAPFFVGIVVTSIILSYGINSGAPLNPARDFPGRIMCSITNSKPNAWIVNGGHWWVIPTIGPLIGGIVGAWIYLLFIEIHHPKEGTDAGDPLGEIEYQKIPKHEGDNNFNLSIHPRKQAGQETKMAET